MFRKLLIAIAAIIAVVSAGSKDLCTAGSDSECARFGSNMCCAHIKYTFKGDNQEFYACASKPGIEYSGGQIYDKYGFTGSWECAFASGLQFSVLAAAAVATTLAFWIMNAWLKVDVTLLDRLGLEDTANFNSKTTYHNEAISSH